MNMATYRTISSSIPEKWAELFLSTANHPVFTYAGNPNSQDALTLADIFNPKEHEDAITNALSGDGTLSAEGLLLAEIFFEVILMKSQKSLEHFKKLSERYDDAINMMVKTEEQQLLFLQVTSRAWKLNKKRHIQILDKIFSLKYVSLDVLLTHIFNSELTPEMLDLILITIKKVLARSQSLYSGIETIKRRLPELEGQEERMKKATERLEDSQKKLEECQAEEKSMFLRIFKELRGKGKNNFAKIYLRQNFDQVRGYLGEVKETMAEDYFEL